MRTVKIVSAVAAFAFGTALPTTGAPASKSSPVPGGGSSLTLTLSVGGGPARSVSLQCDQEGGSHPDLSTACGLVRKVDGDLSKLTYDIDMICPDEHVPHTVGARGTWQGRPVWFDKTYDNRCEMTALTGSLFYF
ncbi:SSI family serine proteinase inhibitor [Streptosporangium sp. NPDC000396]|uniref:SSI family serine proteinase inhibitor n=1 Tax=Streptosporangium sp. NPDC000396 TaxID=3366185 RepID=UPI0036791CA7